MFSRTIDFFEKYPSVVSLFVANIITIFFAFLFNWGVLDLMLIYIIQSIIIGFFSFLKILLVSIKSSGTNAVLGVFVSFWFLLIHICVHVAYASFIISIAPDSLVVTNSLMELNASSIGFFIAVLAFFINHLFSFVYYSKKATFSLSKINRLIDNLCARIIPIHITILLGAIFLSYHVLDYFFLLVFMLSKTMVDLKTHKNEHKNELVSL